ncbi:MAG: molecular chaperone Hsp33 [Marinovum sp.]|jgi:molecular chaperone Hsp33|nr:molecular chaperone Hsp33 [Marinovum sp.]|tara:strand:- start:6198 stop:7187 length:990 start_codon:yes stop_codon:yes gene_type:complete
MSLGNKIAWDDTVLPFQLDAADMRGRIARLDGVLQGILKQHQYPKAVEALVAEMALLTALIGESIKLQWKLSLQVQTNGPVRMIATDFYAPKETGETAQIRAYASFDKEKLTDKDPFDQLGKGYFAVLIDQGEGTKPYQGLSPLNGRSLSDSAETYFAQSEQLPTVFHLKFDKIKQANMEETWRAGGIMVQHLPTSNFQASEENSSDPSGLLSSQDLLNGDNAENWNRINYHLNTIEDLELIGPSVTPSELLVRLFHEEQPRIFDTQSVRFGCSCSEDRVRQSLSIYSAKDISQMITSDGLVTADCQFCGAHYELDPKSVGFEAINSGT